MKKFIAQSIQHLIVFFCIAFFAASCDKQEFDTTAVDTTTSNNQTTQSTLRLEPQSIESLMRTYAQNHKDEKLDSVRMATVYYKFMDIMRSNERFGDKKPCHIQPIYAYGVTGVAYHEIWFAGADKTTAEGWVLLSATDKDYPLVNFSHGTPYSADLLSKAGNTGKIYRFGVSYYALETNGRKIAEHGSMPTSISNSASEKSESGTGDSKDPSLESKNGKVALTEGSDYFTIHSYDELKQLFPKYYFSENRKRTASQMNDKFFADNSLNKISTRAYQYRYIAGSHGFYTQIPGNSGYNPFPCWSGCNNNAWANIYAWWDRNMSKGYLIPTTATGETSPIYRNTYYRQVSSDPVQMYCRSVSNTYCGSGTGWTLWSDCWRGSLYAGSKGYGYTYYYQWCNSGGCNINLANIATDGIANNYRPVHIGANSHFYVGYGWSQWDTNTDWTWAYCYPGWAESNKDDVWILWHDWNAAVKLFIN